MTSTLPLLAHCIPSCPQKCAQTFAPICNNIWAAVKLCTSRIFLAGPRMQNWALQKDLWIWMVCTVVLGHRVFLWSQGGVEHVTPQTYGWGKPRKAKGHWGSILVLASGWFIIPQGDVTLLIWNREGVKGHTVSVAAETNCIEKQFSESNKTRNATTSALPTKKHVSFPCCK